MVKLREVRLWMMAWLANAAALTAVFVHAFADMPLFGHRVTLVLYLAGKSLFAILIVAGARNHLRPGIAPSVSPNVLLAGVALWSIVLGFALPNLWQAQLAESILVGTIFLVGGIVVLRNPRSRISRWLGWAMLFESAVFIYSAALLVPALWGNESGFAYLNHSSFVDTGAELMLALACISVIADRREQQLQYANHELLESQQRLNRLVDTDPLTNLANRRALRRTMDSAIETGGAIIFIDINRFREVNDLFGLSIGDNTLQRLANLTTEQFRPEDHVIRWGDDEFLVIAPGMEQSDARARVGAIRESLRRPLDGAPALSIAVGVAELPPGGDATAALEEADRRMYAEKRHG